MVRLPHVTVSASRPFFLALCVIIFILFTAWAYRRTLPPVSVSLRRLLFFFRIMVFLLLCFSLFGVIVRVDSRRTLLPRVAVIVDDSRSMMTEDAGIGREGIVRAILNSAEMDALRKRADVQQLTLTGHKGEQLWMDPDSLVFNGNATDFSIVFEALEGSEMGWDAALLLSDGAHNLGKDPLRSSSRLDFPVFCITVGSSAIPPDLVVTGMMTNDIAFVGHRIPVDVNVRGPGFGGRRVRVRITTDGIVAGEQVVMLSETGLESSVRFYVEPEREGLLRIRADAAHLEGESNYENNAQEVVTRVRRSRFKVMLVAGAPHPDLAFLKRILTRNENLEIIARTQKRDGFYEGDFPTEAQLQEMDIIVFMDFPSLLTSESVWQRLVRTIRAGNKPFILFTGKNLTWDKVRRIEGRLPIMLPVRLEDRPVLPSLSPEGRIHPIMRIREEVEENNALWDRLPPVYINAVPSGLSPGSQILASGISAETPVTDVAVPLVVSQFLGDSKAILFLGNGLYRWDLLMWGVGESNEVLTGFVENSVRWLTTLEDQSPVRVFMSKALYHAGEEIFVTANVSDEVYQPISGAMVTLELEGSSEMTTRLLTDEGDGRYRGALRLVESGTYTARIEAFLQGRSLGRASETFWVSPFSPEMQDTRAHPELLTGISRLAGGKAGPPDSLRAILQDMSFPSHIETTTREFDLSHRIWLLAALVLILAAEWTLRKRRGMM